MSVESEPFVEEWGALFVAAVEAGRLAAGEIKNFADPGTVANVLEWAAQREVDEMYGTVNELLDELVDLRSGFERRLVERWGEGLRHYELAMGYAHDLGASFNQEQEASAAAEQDLRFEALRRLHARSCAIASEILVLLKTGHADGALARWRSLYELAAVALFLSESGVDLSERFLLHEIVVAASNAMDYAEYGERSGLPAQDPSDLEELRSARDDLLGRFKRSFGERPYGWAASEFKGKAPGVRLLAKRAGIDQWIPLWNMASDYLHAGAKGTAYVVDQRGPYRFLRSGPTNAGLADPGHAALNSLLHVTTAFLFCRVPIRPRWLTGVRGLERIVSDSGDLLLKADQDLREDERRVWEE